VNTKQSIPFLDLATTHIELEEELTGVFKSALHTAGFIGGPVVEQFEQAFAKFCGPRTASGLEMEPMRCGSHWRPPA